MYLISFYVPETHLKKVKNALYEKGAGRFKNYDYCSWQTKGRGQFRPLEGSKPFLGESGKIQRLDEYKVEMICRDSILIDVLETLLKVHPYEEPAYHAVKTITLDDTEKLKRELT